MCESDKSVCATSDSEDGDGQIAAAGWRETMGEVVNGWSMTWNGLDVLETGRQGGISPSANCLAMLCLAILVPLSQPF